MDAANLSLADLEAYDPRGGRGGRERRFRCPLPGCDGDRARNLSVNLEGVWTCYKCGESGRVIETRSAREPWKPQDRAAKSRAMVASMSGFQAVPATKPPPIAKVHDPKEGGYDFERERAAVVSLGQTEGARYLESRGLTVEGVHACGVRFTPSFGCGRWWPEGEGKRYGAGRPAVVFPLRGQDGAVSGIAGRASSRDGYLFKDRDGKPINKQTRKLDPEGDAGVFTAPRDALRADAVALVEAPIDALTLHLCGLPTVATIGTGCPEWLVDALAFRVVFLAHDDDQPDPRGIRAGDAAADRIAAELRAVGARPVRLRPPLGAKDWNEALQRFGHAALSEALAQTVAPYLTPPPSEEPAPYADPAGGLEIQTPPQLREDALESASMPSEASEHTQRALDALTGHSLPYRPSRFHWPGVGSAEYQDLPRIEGEKAQWEACAAAGFRESYALHQLLGRWESGHNAPHDRALILEKVRLIEEEAIAANPQRRL